VTAAIGHLLVLSALVIAVFGACASYAGGHTARPDLVALGRAAVLLVFGLVTLACGVMIYALVTHDFSVKYVADVGSRQTPLYYSVISLWGALEGSILFWGLILAGYSALVVLIHRNAYESIMPYVVGTLLAVSAFFLFVMAGPGNPFVYLAHPPSNGPGPNPLLQNNPMMGLHPPLLYLGYVGLSVPFAIVFGALLAGDLRPSMLALTRRWALVSWGFLTLGIIAGMWWSYAVLGWGGYWSWDPVENAVLMPWLITTAFLHSIQVHERRQMLKTWTVTLIITAFLLSILGTFLTRSGVLASVHSFTQSSIGPVFLAFLGVVMIASFALILLRSRQLSTPGSLDALASRESAFLLNNLLLVALTFTVLLGTLFPLFAEATTGQRLSVGGPYFDRVAIPIALALLFLMGVGPMLPWGTARWEETVNRLLLPAATAVGILLVLVAAGVRGVGALTLFGLAVFVASSTFLAFMRDLRARQHNTREPWFIAVPLLVRSNPRRYAGYLAHVGVLFIVVGIAASQSYSSTGEKTLAVGQSMSLDGYTLQLAAVQTVPQSNRTLVRSVVNVSQGSRILGSMAPSVNYYPSSPQPVITPALHLGAGQDLYLVDRDIAGNHRWVTLQAYVKPLVSWIWFGGGIVGLGALMALMPRRRRMPVEVAEPAPVRAESLEPAV
jgi:cytochrome c-type biogenesis protein CcmF